MELILVRHGRPRRIRTTDGSPADPGLDDTGRAQASAVAAWLAAEDVDLVVSSPARRARETAAPLADALGLDVPIIDGLREFDTGATEYVPVEQLKAENDPRFAALLRGELYGCVDPDGFRRDVNAAVDGLVDDNPGRRVVAFCHGGVINAATAQLIGLDRTLWFVAEYTSITRILASRDGRRDLRSLGETPHLHPAATR